MVFAVSAFFAASCVTPAQNLRVPAETRAPRSEAPGHRSHRSLSVVFLAIDGVRWQEVFHGVDPQLYAAHGFAAGERVVAETLMPNLHALAGDGGALLGAPDSGTDVFATGPEFLSLPGYAEMLSGRRVSGCRDNACGAIRTATLVDEIASQPGIFPTHVGVITSWPDIGRVAARRPDRIAMSTGRNGGPTRELFRRDPVGRSLVDEAATVSPEPGVGDFRPDRHTARIAAWHLETAQPRFLFVSLGEPDEYAHRGDYRGYLRALRAADLAIGDIARALRERAHQGARTVLFVTADHGRADDFRNHGREHPESSRVWLLAWGTEVSRKPLGAVGARRLSDLAPTLRGLFGLDVDRDPFAGRPLVGLLEGSPP